jgi:hypothetical protein
VNGSAKFLPLLESLHTLLRDYPIQAQMCSIDFDVEPPDGPEVLVQLAETELTATARGLLEWHRTLASSRILAKRTTDGATLHLEVCGQIDTDDTRVEVWGETPFDERLIGAGTQPGQQVPLSVEQLATWAAGLGLIP